MTPPVSTDRLYEEGIGLLRGAYLLDHSTSLPELGTIFTPHGDLPVQRLKRRLASWYGVEWAFPGTHGTTVLNVLALLSACPAGGRVLVNRDAHTSVNAAMIQGDFEPVYYVPPYDEALGLSLGPTVEGVRAALDEHQVDCLFLTSPNYFGITGELGGIVDLAHDRGLPVVVDAAHAPHFHFCTGLPIAAEDAGADLVTQSTHKVASALSQGSLLLIRNRALIDPLYEHINELGMVSTSFSYPILASIELGVRQLAEEGQSLWSRTIERADVFRSAIRGLPGIDSFGHERGGTPGFVAFDPTRVTLDVSGLGVSGYDLERELHAAGLYPEMATLRHLLFLITPGTSDDDLGRLYGAIERLVTEMPRGTATALPAPPPPPAMVIRPRAAKFAPKRVVPVNEGIGAVCGETISTYPPGVPIVAAGELLTREAVDYLQCVRARGGILKGASDPELRTVRVL